MKTVVAVVLVLVGLTSGGILEDKAIYKIKNSADGGVLSMKSLDSTAVYLRPDINDAGQKWRAKKPTFMRSEWELKPTSDESNDLTVEVSTSAVKAMPQSGDAKYWHISDYGQGSFQVKSYATSQCLTSQGLNRKVTLSPCANTPQQDWKFKEL